MSKICTSLEQSKKLIKLGVDVNTADMYWWFSGKRYYIEAMDDGDFNEEEGHVRAWSLAALLSVLPFHLITNNQRYAFNMHKGLDKDGETYMFRYNVFNTDVCLYSTDYYNNPVDACYEMIIKLHEQKIL